MIEAIAVVMLVMGLGSFFFAALGAIASIFSFFTKEDRN